jgi:hypothetical protein
MRIIRIICDNGGGITLQLGDWAHFYYGPGAAEQCAEDIMAYRHVGNAVDWPGHDSDALGLDPSDEDIRNHGYRVYYSAEEVIADEPWDWQNVYDLAVALKRLGA